MNNEEFDREPQPSDGPEYHDEWTFWAERERRRGVWVCPKSCNGKEHTLMCHTLNRASGRTLHERKRNMGENWGIGERYMAHAGYRPAEHEMGPTTLDDSEKNAGSGEVPGTLEFKVTLVCNATQLAELEKQFAITDVRLNRPGAMR